MQRVWAGQGGVFSTTAMCGFSGECYVWEIILGVRFKGWRFDNIFSRAVFLMPQSAIVCGKRRHHNHWSFSCSPPRKKNNKLLAFCLYSRGLFLFNKWFGRAHSYDVQVQKYSSLASADHCAFRLSLIATCVSHKAHVNVLMVNLSDRFWRGEQWTFLIG